jgi:hypothetical protein
MGIFDAAKTMTDLDEEQDPRGPYSVHKDYNLVRKCNEKLR